MGRLIFHQAACSSSPMLHQLRRHVAVGRESEDFLEPGQTFTGVESASVNTGCSTRATSRADGFAIKFHRRGTARSIAPAGKSILCRDPRWFLSSSSLAAGE